MKWLKKTPIFLSFLSMCLLAFCFCSKYESDENDEKTKATIRNVRKSLAFLHYSPQAVDDDFSKKVFDNYIESLDPSKRFLLESDVNFFKNDLYKLDDYFNEEKLEFYNSTVDTIYKRYTDAENITQQILKKPFHLDLDEHFVVDPEERSHPKNEIEFRTLWKKSLKYNVLNEILQMQEDSINTNKSLAELEKEARAEVADYMSDFFRRMKKGKRSNFLSKYINSFTTVYDPHTTYFSPIEKKGFEESISGQLQGIGARLQDKKGYATIVELIVGGPAWKSKELEVGDQIVKVQEGLKGEPKNIVGMLLEESIEFIKGKKGTTVVLTIKQKDGNQKLVTLERDVIEIADTFARSTIIENQQGEKYGMIYLPEFYINFNEDIKGRDASDDVAYEIEQLKKQDIKGLIFDLRGNGGGSLKEVVEIVGHFIKKGPVVQVKNSDGKMQIHKDTNPDVLYDGNLVVLVNELSASASEIMAAALQDYNRAIIIGSKKTFGKGTVQSIYPLSRNGDLGAIKMTVQKYYRINGGSTQINGVGADIVIPSQYNYSNISEAAQDYALAWDKIREADYNKFNLVNYDQIINTSKQRLQQSNNLTLINESAQYLKKMEDIKSISLNLDMFKALNKERKQEAEKFKTLEEYRNQLKLINPEHVHNKIQQDSVLTIKRENWHKSLNSDFYLQESVNVLQDMLQNQPLLSSTN